MMQIDDYPVVFDPEKTTDRTWLIENHRIQGLF